MRMRWTLAMSVVVALLGGAGLWRAPLAGVALAQIPEPKGALPDAPEVAEEARPESLDALARAWRAHGRPRVRVVVTVGGQATAEARIVESELVRQLAGSLGAPQVTDDRALVELRAGTLMRLGSPEFAREAAASLARALGTDQVLRLELAPAAGTVPAGNAREVPVGGGTYQLHDLRFNQRLDEGPLVAYSKLPLVTVARRYAAHVIDSLARAYARSGEGERPLLFTIAGLERQEDLDELTRAVREMPAGAAGPRQADAKFTRGRERVALAELVVWARIADQDSVRLALSEATRGRLKRRLMVVDNQPGTVQGIIVPAQPADWAVLTTAADMPAKSKERVARIKLDRSPTIVVLVGEGLDEVPASGGAAPSGGGPMNADELANELGTWFRAAGFEVQDGGTVRARIKQLRAEAADRDGAAGLVRAAQRAAETDFVLLASPRAAAGAVEAGYNLRLIDRRGDGARLVGFQSWPDQRFMLYDEPTVNERDAASVSRYIAGNLLSNLDAYLGAPGNVLRSVRVTVLDARSADDAMVIARALQSPGGFKVTGLAVRRHEGQMMGAMDVVGVPVEDLNSPKFLTSVRAAVEAAKVPMMIELSNGGELVLRLLAPPPAEQAAAEAGAERPADRPAPGQPVPARGPAVADALNAALATARESIWQLGVRDSRDRFLGVGTGWTVRKDRLATNAHVIGDILMVSGKPEKHGLAGDLQIAARRWDGKQWVWLELEKPEVHPGYLGLMRAAGRAEARYTVFAFDVGLITVRRGSPGPALKLATPSDLRGLRLGDPIGYVGFPGEGQAISREAPPIAQHVGQISALGDEMLRACTPDRVALIQASFLIRGGGSGSPVLSPDGRVIGLVSAGDTYGTFRAEFELRDPKTGQVITENNQPVYVRDDGVTRIMAGAAYVQSIAMLEQMLAQGGAGLSDAEADEIVRGRPRRGGLLP